jgi:ADP-heptose:LPS heptosyltransferase
MPSQTTNGLKRGGESRASVRLSSRWRSRLAILPRAAVKSLWTLARRRRPANPRRILIAHRLLLGDTLMLTALIAKLRHRYPLAEIVMTVAPALLPLYSQSPYGVKAIPWDPAAAAAFRELQRAAGAMPFDLAIVPGDNRHALLARALGARWIVALAGDRPAWKNHIVDELVPIPRAPASLADLFASLAGDAAELQFNAAAWPAPQFAPFALPETPYAVLHVGAGSPLRLWDAEKWLALAAHLSARGLRIAWSAGPGEAALIEAIVRNAPEGRDKIFPGTLDLAQLWHLLAKSCILVAPDSGIAHLAKHTGTPTVCVFGPGSATLFGAGSFWRSAKFRAVTVDDYPCRDQTTLFKRDISWVRRCQRAAGGLRTAATCPAPDCMHAISVASVTAAADALLE